MKTRIHAIAGGIGFLMILTFWTSTVFSELFGSYETIANVKAMILRGMIILIPAMIIVGGSGMALGGKRTDILASTKKKRMPIIAANGLLILLPMAFILADKAASGAFDTWFYGLQAIELLAGGTNLTLMGLNIRDGLRMTGKIGKNNKAKLISRELINNGSMVLHFAKPKGFQHDAGQWTRLTLIDPCHTDREGTARSITIASAPHDTDLTFATRLSTSAFKQALAELPIGAEVKVSDPQGIMTLPKTIDRPVVFLAGGIGITPFLAMARHATRNTPNQKISLFYSSRTAKDAVFLDELTRMDKTNSNFKLIATISDETMTDWQGETGRIDAEMLNHHLDDIHAPIYYLVGSPAMVMSMRTLLEKQGVAEQDIHTEEFSGY